jgi:diaminohydroxyphosphoribosylaminopyrimidine deaminase/5-amino-6-(5-phosphoribosylamino)uracil reductase
MNRDDIYMRRAIALAKRAQGLTSPNPIVGACVVKGRKVIAEGFHEMAGLPHAEANALKLAGPNARGATLYVTLEPCDHYGRTPPCTEAIISSGVRKVVIGMRDPNPINNGRGIKALLAAGMKTTVGVLEDEANAINRPYIKFITRGLPYVTVKMAQSLDGKIATRTGDSRWITSEDARRYVRGLRGRVDAVMVGVKTLLRDDPVLTPPLKAQGTRLRERRPVRIIVDSELKTPPNAKIFTDRDRYPVIITTTKRAKPAKKKALEGRGARILMLGAKSGRVDLKKLLESLAKMGIVHVLVEGGGELSAGLLEAHLVDRILFFIAPRIIGGRDATTSVEGRGVNLVSGAIDVDNVKIRRFSNDILIEGEIAACSRAS